PPRRRGRRCSANTPTRCWPDSATRPPTSPPCGARESSDGTGRVPRNAAGAAGLFLSELEANFAADEQRLSVERPDPQRVDVLSRLLVELVREVAAVDAGKPAVVLGIISDRRAEQRPRIRVSLSEPLVERRRDGISVEVLRHVIVVDVD